MIVLKIRWACLCQDDFLAGKVDYGEMLDVGKGLNKSDIAESEALVWEGTGIKDWCKEYVGTKFVGRWERYLDEILGKIGDEETSWSIKSGIEGCGSLRSESEEGGCVIEWGVKNGNTCSWKSTSLETKNCSVWGLNNL